MAKVSGLPPLYNLEDEDLVEVSKYVGVGLGDDGGDYKSYSMTYAIFKQEVAYRELTKIELSEFTLSQTYQVSRFEKIIGYTFVQSLSTDTIKITNNATAEVYVDTTDDNARDFTYFSTDSTASNRVLLIELSAEGTVYIHSIKNLIP